MISVRDGLRLRVEDRGEGPATLLVHGFTGSVEAWGEEVLDGLADGGRRILAVDLPGHGRSDVAADPDRVTMERVVRDLTEILDALDLEGPDWVGYSMGGRIALAAAVLEPRRVGRLVLEGASPGLETEREREERRDRDDALAERILDDGIEAFVDFWMELPLFDTQKRLPEARRKTARERRLRCSPDGLAAALRGLGTGRQPSFWNALESVRSPVLLLTGRADRKFTDIADRMAELLPRAQRLGVPKAGHTVHFEAPRIWLRHVIRFLEAGPTEPTTRHQDPSRSSTHRNEESEP